MYATQVNGGADVLDVMAGGRLDESAQEWFQQQAYALQNTVSGAAQQFFNQARDMYQTVSDTQAMQMLRNLTSRRNTVWSDSLVMALKSLEQLQTAGPVMQRWVMANPVARERYLNDTLEGYGDSYDNVHGDAIGRNHSDYRHVTNTLAEVTDEGWVARNYFEFSDTPVLSQSDRLNILNTWDLLEHYLDEGDEDPTSPYGNPL